VCGSSSALHLQVLLFCMHAGAEVEQTPITADNLQTLELKGFACGDHSCVGSIVAAAYRSGA
jgi:hypothetical protein